MAKAGFIGFRPGSLAGEFAKRAPDGQASILAKTLLARTFAMLKAEAARLRDLFGPAEMQVVVSALYDEFEDALQIPRLVAHAIANDPLCGHIAKLYSVDIPKLNSKLETLSPGALFAIQDGLTQLRCLPFNEIIDPNGFPSLAALRRMGLLKVQGHQAWGLCFVKLLNHSVSEFVLRYDPTNMALNRSSHALDDLTRSMVTYTRSMLAGERDPDKDAAGFGLAYSIAVETGWRYFRVEEHKGDNAIVIQVPPDAIQHDETFSDLAFEGLNAPEAAERVASKAVDRKEAAVRPRKRYTAKRS